MSGVHIRALRASDHERALTIINSAAAWYREFLPPAEVSGPEMSVLDGTGDPPRLDWYGAYSNDELVAVAALEYVHDAALLRHAYVLPAHQRSGTGSALTRHLESCVRGATRIVVGTYAANYKARSVLEKLGYQLSNDSEAVLRRYYDIPQERLRGSVTYEKVPGPARVYGDYDQAALDAQYDQRTLVPDLAPYLARWRDDSAAAHATLNARVDIAYGPSAAECLDLFSDDQARGLVVYLHGGAWRTLGKAESAYPAPALVGHGLSFAAIEFALVPTVSLREQVQQCRAAVAWLYRHARAEVADNICLLGHSSGAHLAALLATTDWHAQEGLPQDVVKSAVLVSGLYDLEPVRLSARNDYLHLDRQDVLDLSPARHVRPAACPLVMAWGDQELDEFQRQSIEFAQAWRAAGNRCVTLPHVGANHFDMAFPFAVSGTPLHQSMLSVALAS